VIALPVAREPDRSAARLPGVWHPEQAAGPGNQFAGRSRGPSSAASACSQQPRCSRDFQAQQPSTIFTRTDLQRTGCWPRAVPQKGPSRSQSQQTHQEQRPARPITRALPQWLPAKGDGMAAMPLRPVGPSPFVVVAFNPTCSGATPRRAAMAARIARCGAFELRALRHHHRVHIDHLPARWRHQAPLTCSSSSRLSAHFQRGPRGEMEADVRRG